MRIGLGEDSHRFSVEEKPLVLGGVLFEGEQGLDGDSDADVVLHSLCNAIGTAIGLGALGRYATKMEREQGIVDSSEYVKVALKEMHDRGFKVINVAFSIEGKKPRIEPLREKMQARIARLIGVKKDCVGISATTGDGLTGFGRGEGVFCSTIILLGRRSVK